MAAVSTVYSLRYAAAVLGEDEDFLDRIAIEMEPERGRLIVVLWHGTEADENTLIAFTAHGLEYLKSLVEEYKRLPWPI